MEEYHRDSLRQMRRMELEQQSVKRERGSVWITLLIILLFLAAGGFYLKTTGRLSTVKQTVIRWGEELVSVFQPQESEDVQQTVNQALEEQNERV